MSIGTPFFNSKLKFSYNKYSVEKVWTKIYCHFYFSGITSRWFLSVALRIPLVRTIFALSERANDRVHLHNERNFPQAKLNIEINARFLLNGLVHNNSVHIILLN